MLDINGVFAIKEGISVFFGQTQANLVPSRSTEAALRSPKNTDTLIVISQKYIKINYYAPSAHH